MEGIILIIYIVVFVYSVIFHEVAHGFVANKFGDDTAKILGRLSLNPIVHIDLFGSIIMPLLLYLSTGFAFGYAKPVPVNPYRLKSGKVAYRWVALAGILTNLSLSVLAALILKVTTQNFGFGGDNLGVIFFQLVFILNLVLAIFNAMPLPGFDGFNFLNTFDPIANLIRKTPLGNPVFMAQYGLFISLLLFMFFWPILGKILYFFIAIFSTVFRI
jgi:Zn-dependent protease